MYNYFIPEKEILNKSWSKINMTNLQEVFLRFKFHFWPEYTSACALGQAEIF